MAIRHRGSSKLVPATRSSPSGETIAYIRLPLRRGLQMWSPTHSALSSRQSERTLASFSYLGSEILYDDRTTCLTSLPPTLPAVCASIPERTLLEGLLSIRHLCSGSLRRPTEEHGTLLPLCNHLSPLWRLKADQPRQRSEIVEDTGST